MFLSYDINAGVGYKNKTVDITYSAPNISIYTVSERNSGDGWRYKSEKYIKFDVLKVWYDNR